MILGKSILAVVPARGGSKGIPLKNLRKVCGYSLIELTAKIVDEIPEIDRCVVSTDHEGIALAAIKAGIDAPFRRPADLSGDLISDLDVLTHALLTMERLDQVCYDIILMLQPTSPLRRSVDVRGVIDMLQQNDYDSVWSVSKSDTKTHPLKQLVIQDNLLEYWDPRGSSIIARQQLEPVYQRNGVAYAVKRSCLLGQKTIKGSRTGAYVIQEPQISVDTEWDIELIEFLTQRGLASFS